MDTLTPRGFSVLEILIAMAIVVSAITAVMLISPGLQSTSVDAQLNMEALGRAQQAIEEQQALSRKDFKLVNPVAATTSGMFTTEIQVSQIDLLTKNVVVRVSWNAQYGRGQAVSLSTRVSDFQNAIGGDTCSSIVTGNWASPQIVNSSKQRLGQDILGDSSGTYVLSDIDVYQKRAYISVDQGSVTTASQSPTTAANRGGIPSAAGNWTPNPTTAVNTSDSTDATVTMNGGASSNYLWVTGFGPSLAIPKGATILGITATVRRSASNNSAIRDNQVRLIRPDGTTLSFSSKPNVNTWTTSEIDATYGGVADRWGDEWTSDDINNPNFGLAIAVTNTSGSSRTARVDYVSVTVTYRKQFYALGTADPANPSLIGPLVTATNTIAVDAGYKGLAVATSTVTGSYAFAATNSTLGQLQVINVSGSPKIVHTVALASAPGASTIFYKDGYIYLGLPNNPSGPELYILDVHNPLNIPALTGTNFTYEVGAGINALYVKNNKAYIATDDYTKELVVLDISDLAHPAPYAVYDAPPTGSTTFGLGKSLYTVGDRLYFGRYYIAGAPELAIIDTKSSTLAHLGSSDIGPNSSNAFGIYGLIARDTRAFALTGATAGGQLRVLDISNPGSIGAISSTALPNAGSGVALDCEGNYVYAASVPLTGLQQNKGTITIFTAP